MHHESTVDWWRSAVIYQVYLRSFADGNGDGTGDLAGLRAKLPYLRELGVDAIWVNPWYPSPLNDGGYDVADYFDIDPRFGTLDDVRRLVDEAHALGLRLLADLVPNHTSSEHAWFSAALAAAPGSRERDRYHFRDGRGPGGAEAPTDWRSNFGGSAWTRVPDGQWYLHLFDVTQPDLNWTNPDVLEYFHDVLRFWLDLGIDGFRVDVAHSLTKDMTFPDIVDHLPREQFAGDDDHPHWDRDDLHEIVRGWRRVLDEYDDRMMVAEAWVADHRRPLYVRHDEYHQAFDFGFLESEWSVDQLRGAITTGLGGTDLVGSPPTWVLSNHDVVRHATRYGLPLGTKWRKWPLDGPHDALDVAAGTRRARAAIVLMLALPGAAYLYQGEELGLHEVWDLPIDVIDDPVWTRSGHTEKGRDGCRVPLPWRRDGDSYGFGANGSWLPQPSWFAGLSAEAQDRDPMSVLSLYRATLAARRELLDADLGFEWLDRGPDAIAFRRGQVEVTVYFGHRSVPIEGSVLVASGPLPDGAVPTDTAVWTTA